MDQEVKNENPIRNQIDTSGLRQPVRWVEFTIDGRTLEEPRGADDPTPDHVLRFDGMRIDLKNHQLTIVGEGNE